ncbi:MAG: electron transfer flavoprotein subunit alpha/FixB family protein, partial [Prolixibacteraceae bacterium]|nr:electron transfer flavoprotein subunit alpha/FixB family protein [Prolixibacteraceae bacterium]
MSVLVYTENWDGVFKKLSFELVSYATKVAEMIGTSVTAVSIGDVADDELNRLGTFGALKVIKVEGNTNLDNQVYTSILAEVAKAEDAKVVVISHNNTGKAIAPRLSVKLNAAVGAGLIKLPVSTNPFTVSKKVFSGKAKANVVLKTDVKILTLSQNSFEVIEKGGAATIETFAADVSDAKTVVKDVQKQTGKILLNDAEMVVSGGRGLKSADNWG